MITNKENRVTVQKGGKVLTFVDLSSDSSIILVAIFHKGKLHMQQLPLFTGRDGVLTTKEFFENIQLFLNRLR